MAALAPDALLLDDSFALALASEVGAPLSFALGVLALGVLALGALDLGVEPPVFGVSALGVEPPFFGVSALGVEPPFFGVSALGVEPPFFGDREAAASASSAVLDMRMFVFAGMGLQGH